ncbi:hypothetical protein CCR75_007236 [Bremia lactucae]|uniref:Uncharacterized protein n=1 Tax=Bremia lactucae TaxID=4779 RepID=A0A976FSM5_BRELC|nr:hypothetical protein CCR75_007236 [Bremia lactucae]
MGGSGRLHLILTVLPAPMGYDVLCHNIEGGDLESWDPCKVTRYFPLKTRDIELGGPLEGAAPLTCTVNVKLPRAAQCLLVAFKCAGGYM